LFWDTDTDTDIAVRSHADTNIDALSLSLSLSLSAYLFLLLYRPCRDPIDHLMSLCNHKRRNFTCYDDDDQLELLEKEIQNCIVGKSKCNKYGCVVSSKEEIDNIRNYQMNIHEKYSKEYTMKTKLNKKQASSSSSSSSIIIENGNNDENEEEREAPERSRRRQLRADNNDDNNNDNNNNKVLKKTIAHQKVVSANRGGLQFSIQLTNKNINPLIDTKCFNPIPLTPYINYVGDKLYPRYIQIESNKYFHRTSNAIHKPNLECLKQKQIDSKAGSKSSQLYINKVKQIIFQKYKYFNWCNDCMGTNNQLQL
jgi:hypothetical protein